MIKLRKKQKGFTLVELLIVIAIIAVLAAVVTPVTLSAINKSKATAVYAEMKSLETADLTHYVQNGEYFEDTAGFANFEINGVSFVADVFTSKNGTYTITANADGKRVITATDVADNVKTELDAILSEEIETGDYLYATT